MASVNDIGKSIIAAAPTVAPSSAARALRWIIDFGVEGTGYLPGARVSAGRHLSSRHGDVEAAIDTIIYQHTALAGAQGFVTNLAGLVVSLVSMPANLAGVAIVQSRMVACIAHLRGYDVADSRVRQAIVMTLLGKRIVDSLVADQVLPGSPLVVATAPVLDEKLEQQIAERVMSALLSQSGGKQLVSMIGRRIPVIGGGVGAATDGYNTVAVGRYARDQFVNRRPALRPQAPTQETSAG